MYYPLQFLFSFLASLAFAIIYNSPRRSQYKSALIGAVGWTLFKFCYNHSIALVMSCFIAAFVIGIVAEYSATIFKLPAINFFLPAIIPLVPGSGMYFTMYNLVSKDYDAAAAKGVETFFMAVAIAVGVFVATNIAGNIRSMRIEQQKYKN